MIRKTSYNLFFLLLVFASRATTLSAEDLNSTNFIIRDPVIGTQGGFSDSGNFQLFSAGDKLFTGAASSVSFLARYGFLYFPDAASGTITVTPETGSVGSIPQNTVRFSGYAYPQADVFLLKGGMENASVLADEAGYFTITLKENEPGSVIYILYAVDKAGHKSLIINYPIIVYKDHVTQLSGIKFPPTIFLDKLQSRSDDYLTVTGYGLPTETLEISVQGSENRIFTFIPSLDGAYKMRIPLGNLPKGEYNVSAKYANDGSISKLVKFIIGDTDIFSEDDSADIPGDCNADKVINLVDFSVLAFWYGKSNPPGCVDTNGDAKVDLVDFSILAFWWTG